MSFGNPPIAIPRFITYHLQILNMCDDPNQPPNILHCLKLVCPKLGFPLTLICPLIPDKPEEAAKFLNIKPPKTEL